MENQVYYIQKLLADKLDNCKEKKMIIQKYKEDTRHLQIERHNHEETRYQREAVNTR